MEERILCLEADPEVASLNMGPDMSRFRIPPRPAPLEHPHDGLIYDECIPFTYGFIESLAAHMKEKGIKPEMEIYQPGNYWVSDELIKKNLIEPAYLFQFIMGYQTSIYPSPENLISLIRELPKNSIFSTVGVGKFQWYMTTLSIILGGHVRVGLEDNIYLKRGEKLNSNAEAVEKITRIAKELGREIATPAEARKMLDEIMKMIVGKGGMVGYLETNDMRAVKNRIQSGDEYARLVYEAMAYQVAKETGARTAVLSGSVDAVILTGGLAYDLDFIRLIEERISFSIFRRFHMGKGIIKFDEERCKGCELCISVCPIKIIKMHDTKTNANGFHPAGIEEMDKCIACASCAMVCPDVVITVYAED